MFVDIKVKIILYTNITRKKQFLFVIGKLSGQFIFKQDTERQRGHLRQSVILPVTSQSVHWFQFF